MHIFGIPINDQTFSILIDTYSFNNDVETHLKKMNGVIARFKDHKWSENNYNSVI